MYKTHFRYYVSHFQSFQPDLTYSFPIMQKLIGYSLVWFNFDSHSYRANNALFSDSYDAQTNIDLKWPKFEYARIP